MFLAIGTGAWAAAIYHFATHAMFKSALFLGAGVIIIALENEHNIFKMGGLRKQFPKTFIAFASASLTLAAIPPLTITFNSKDLILNSIWAASNTNKGLWLAGTLGAFLTSVYTFRLLYFVFFGETKTKSNTKPAAVMLVPLGILALFAAISGIPELISNFFGIKTFYNFLQTSLPQSIVNTPLPAHKQIMQIFYASVSLLGVVLTYIVCRYAGKIINTLMNTFITSYLYRLVQAGFGFDWVYEHLLVRPYIWIARINRIDVLNRITDANIYIFRRSNLILSRSVSGNIRWYAACVGIGAIILLGIVILL